MDYRDYSWRELLAECWWQRPFVVLAAPFCLLLFVALFAAWAGFRSDVTLVGVLIGAAGSIAGLGLDRFSRRRGRGRRW